jgi:hypothetical protein
MERMLKIRSNKNDNSDYQYWLSKSYQERIEAIELLRLQYLQIMGDNKSHNVQPRLQRIYSITQQKQS